MNKKKLLIVILLICVVFTGWKFIINPGMTSGPAQPAGITPTTPDRKPQVSVIIDNGQTAVTYDGIPAATAFDALSAVSTRYNIPVEKKQYDFGVFIEKIGNNANTKEKAWIYLVNGQSGDVAADKKITTDGDKVEWRYTKPMY
jgi:hypothetical protein